MANSASVTNRVPVSLRLPADIAMKVDEYAKAQQLRRTDAYLHFIRLGLEGIDHKLDAMKLDGIEQGIREIRDLLYERSGSDSDDVRTSISEIVNAITVAASKYPAIEKAYLFGSFARKTASDSSDIDIRLVLDRSKRFNLHDLEHFSKEVEQVTGRGVDVVTADILKNENLAAAIESEKVLVYER